MELVEIHFMMWTKGNAVITTIVLILVTASGLWFLFLNAPHFVDAKASSRLMMNLSTKTEENGTTNLAEYEMQRDHYLKAWQNLTFGSVFNTYVKKGSATGYGVYEPRQSNVFSPGETLELYVEPVGYSFGPVQRENNTFSIDLMADIIVSEPSGREVTALRGAPAGINATHTRNTETFLVLTVTPSQEVPEGDYVITYIVKDKNTGKVFDIVKNIKLAAGLQSRGTLR